MRNRTRLENGLVKIRVSLGGVTSLPPVARVSELFARAVSQLGPLGLVLLNLARAAIVLSFRHVV